MNDTLAPMHLYVVKFRRLGRLRSILGQEVRFTAHSERYLSDLIYGFVRKRLVSGEFSVSFDLASGEGWVEHGRFGQFTIRDCGPWNP